MEVLFLLLAFASTVLSLRCPLNWSNYDSYCYRYFPQRKLFWSASSYCRQQRFFSSDTNLNEVIFSDLASIHSASENAFVHSLVPNRVTVFIGLYHKVNGYRRTWHWTDGTSLDYTNWAPNQPDPSRQKYGTMWNEIHESQWDDADWEPNGVGFVCKVGTRSCLTAPNEHATTCQNGGKFNLSGSIPTCSCPSSYTCIDCSVYNGCESNPCRNGGRCQSTKFDSYSCDCQDGFTGEHCEIYEGCLKFPCENSGSCSKDSNSSIFTCTCPEDYAGVTCETYIGHCRDEPCMHGGVCHSISVSPFYVCDCQPPYVGKRCASTNFDCNDDPCENGGTCVASEKSNGTQCLCPSGYSGITCAQNNRPSKLISSNSSTSSNSLVLPFVLVTIVMAGTILFLIGYIVKIRRRAYQTTSSTFIGFTDEPKL